MSVAEYGRYIGIDVGTKRTGLARTDLLKTVANPIGTFPTDEVFQKLKELVQTEKVEKFVVGWPLTPGGYEGDATKFVEKFIAKLRVIFPDMEIEKLDERYTSKEAVQVMIESGVPPKKRRQRGRIDQAAAAIILQKYLNLDNY